MRRRFDHYYFSSKPFAKGLESTGRVLATSANLDKNRVDNRDIDSVKCIAGLPSLGISYSSPFILRTSFALASPSLIEFLIVVTEKSAFSYM